MNMAFIMKTTAITAEDILSLCLMFQRRDDGDGRDGV